MDSTIDLRKLRCRMGWTSSDLARHLKVKSTEVEAWEKQGSSPKDPEIISRIKFLLRQADMCSDEVKTGPIAENFLDEKALGQVDSDRVKDR
ncbi:MAG TPA: helix-turn-helix transcriptional regulator [Pseudobdellovibrionaceae bacterium]|nr:helix-turn-helix transcriptional regulator [Pseudobdellovibrionaceae bacterium]